MEFKGFEKKKVLDTLRSCFKENEIARLAKESGFIRRSSSRLKGIDFLMMNVFDSTSGKERSLNDCCDWLEEHFGISMRKQSLDERYNTDSVRFLRCCLARLMEKVNGDLPPFKGSSFTKIQLVDATSFRIPDGLAAFYKGYKGVGGKASLKLHLNYNLLDGSIADISLRSGTENDMRYNSEIKGTGGLYMRDLGYYKMDFFESLMETGNYFLSRAKSDAAYSILDKSGNYERIDIYDYLPEKGESAELAKVFLGWGKRKLPVRLIMESVPKEVVLARMEGLRRYASKQRGRGISQKRKDMCHFNLYLTNATSEKLPTSLIRRTYTLRWQIELIFKIWKSVFDIDKIRSMSIFRVECYIYSRLMAIILTLYVQNRFGGYLWEEQQIELSPQKAAKLLKKSWVD